MQIIRSYIEKILFFVLQITRRIPFLIIKLWDGDKLYTQMLMPITGGMFFIVKPRLNKALFPLLLLFLLGVLQGLVMQQWVSVVRCLQAILMLFFCDWIIERVEKEDILNFVRSSLFLSVVYFILEYFLIPVLPPKDFLPGFVLRRFSGVVGESNYSAVFFLGIALVSMVINDKKSYFASLVLIPFTVSRIGVLISLLSLIGFLLQFCKKSLIRMMLFMGIALVITLPFLYLGVELLASEKFKLLFTEISSGRLPITMSYLKMFKDHLLGVGFFNGPKYFQAYRMIGSSVVATGAFDLIDFPLQQHSIILQTLTEFGIWGYIIVSYFLFKLMRVAIEVNLQLAFGWMLLMFAFTTLNGYSELVFYLYIALIVKFEKLSADESMRK